MLLLNFGKLCNVLQEVWPTNVWTPPLDELRQACVKEKMTQVDAVNILYSLVWEGKDLVAQLGYLNVDPKNASQLFRNGRGVHSSIRDQAKQVPLDTVKKNFAERVFINGTEENCRSFFQKMQTVLRETPMGYDTLGLEDFSGAQYNRENLCSFSALLLIWCLLAPNHAAEDFSEQEIRPVKLLPTDGTGHYDPHNLSERAANSTAILIKLIFDSGKYKTFRSSERAVEYIVKSALIIKGFEFEKGLIKARCMQPSVKCILSRVEKGDYEQAQTFIQNHILEFKPKCTWSGRLLSDMALNGLKKEIWTAYAYYNEDGSMIAYLDYKQRSDSEVELGIQLTSPEYRQKYFATGLLNFFCLKFMDNRLFAGTYEENAEMRCTLLKCGFKDNDFFDPETGIKTNKIRERVDSAQPENRQLMTNSVYYYCNSLMCRMRLHEEALG